MEFNLKVGMTYELEKVVTDDDTAAKFGNKGIDVLATPMMIAWIEQTCLNTVLPELPAGYDTVGTTVNIAHLAASPVGMKIRMIAELIEIKGKALTFSIKGYDENNKICEGTHGRAIIDTAKFFGKLKG